MCTHPLQQLLLLNRVVPLNGLASVSAARRAPANRCAVATGLLAGLVVLMVLLLLLPRALGPKVAEHRHAGAGGAAGRQLGCVLRQHLRGKGSGHRGQVAYSASTCANRVQRQDGRTAFSANTRACECTKMQGGLDPAGCRHRREAGSKGLPSLGVKTKNQRCGRWSDGAGQPGGGMQGADLRIGWGGLQVRWYSAAGNITDLAVVIYNRPHLITGTRSGAVVQRVGDQTRPMGTAVLGRHGPLCQWRHAGVMLQVACTETRTRAHARMLACLTCVSPADRMAGQCNPRGRHDPVLCPCARRAALLSHAGIAAACTQTCRLLPASPRKLLLLRHTSLQRCTRNPSPLRQLSFCHRHMIECDTQVP